MSEHANGTGSLFDPDTGLWRDNVRDDLGDLGELRESMREFGWQEHLPAIVDENGVVLVGHRRLVVAGELGIEPNVVRVDYGDGDDQRAAIALTSNIAAKPFTDAERRNIARALYGTSSWSIKRIAKTLHVARDKIADDVDGLPPIRTVTPEAERDVVELASQGLSTRKIGAQVGLGASTVKRVIRRHHEGLTGPRGPAGPGGPRPAKFNQVNDSIGWAKWSWNPVTGCLHNCSYCYARDIANRYPATFPKRFAPDFWPERLEAPQNTSVPAKAAEDPQWRRVFTCSMADLFGKWVPQEWIDSVFEAIVAAPQWEFLCLTKFPQRLAELDWPENTWVGTTVDKQHRVDLAQRHFAEVKAGVKWLSCEPLLEPLKFDSLEMFDWVVIGACTASSGAPEFAPDFDWVIDLYQQARRAGCKVYLKHNLFGARAGAEPGMEPVREWPR